MWLRGDNVGNQKTYFTEEVEKEKNEEKKRIDTKIAYPGSRAGAAFWAHHSGIGWMFGGIGFSDSGTDSAHVLQDLWSFNVLIEKWTLVDSGPGGNVPSKGKLHPGPRHRGAACGVHGLAFAAFGGEDSDSRIKNDTWVFEIPSKMWLPLVIKGPSNRRDMAYWCERSRIVVFGGEGDNNHMLGDMWEFSLRHFSWTKVEPLGSAIPLGRNGALTWRGLSGNLYMYGGQRIEKEEYGLKFSLLSDLWVFNIKDKSWSLLHGDVAGHDKYAQYGTLGKGNDHNTPGPRIHSASWTVDDGLWLYGGIGCGDGTSKCHTHSMLADLWMFNTSTSQWIWQGGPKNLDVHPEYGQKGHSNRTNCPGSRSGSMAWSHQGVGFLFGGLGLDGRHRTSFLNDLWLVGEANRTYIFTKPPLCIPPPNPLLTFLMVFAIIAGVALSFGAVFFIKKMIEYSRHRTNTGDFKVRYSPVSQEATLDT